MSLLLSQVDNCQFILLDKWNDEFFWVGHDKTVDMGIELILVYFFLLESEVYDALVLILSCDGQKQEGVIEGEFTLDDFMEWSLKGNFE